MKHPVKARYDDKIGRTIIDYYKIKKEQDKEAFRFKTLNSILGQDSFFMVINTNLCCTVDNSVPRDNIQVIERYVKDKGFQHVVMPIENTSRKSIFGFLARKKENNPSYKIGFVIPEGYFTESLFNEIFGIYDVEIAMGFVKPEEEMFEDFRKGYFDSLFNKEYFKHGLFNAISFYKIVTDKEVDHAYIESLG